MIVTTTTTTTTTSSSSSLEIAKEWADIDPNPNTSKYTRDLIAKAGGCESSEISSSTKKIDVSSSLLESLFPSDGSRITFGTAGLRSEMKPGPLGMNDVTVYQTAQGLARYCLEQQQQQQQQQQKEDSNKKTLCAVVGYDHRCNPSLNISSLSFAILTAIVFAEAGIDCILLDGLVLTPLVPFALKKLNACCGIMVTASHNPKQDNGYKLYASDGCQIRSPMDKDIANEIQNNLKPWTDYGKILEQRRENFPNDPCLGLSRPELTQEMLTEYYKAIENSGLKTGQATVSKNNDSSLDPPSFAYTAMHGVGYQFAKKVFDIFELPPFKAVPEQKEPDPTFPTGTYILHLHWARYSMTKEESVL